MLYEKSDIYIYINHLKRSHSIIFLKGCMTYTTNIKVQQEKMFCLHILQTEIRKHSLIIRYMSIHACVVHTDGITAKNIFLNLIRTPLT